MHLMPSAPIRNAFDSLQSSVIAYRWRKIFQSRYYLILYDQDKAFKYLIRNFIKLKKTASCLAPHDLRENYKTSAHGIILQSATMSIIQVALHRCVQSYPALLITRSIEEPISTICFLPIIKFVLSPGATQCSRFASAYLAESVNSALCGRPLARLREKKVMKEHYFS